MYLDFLPLPLWLFWWHNNFWGWRKREKSSGIYACRSVKVLDPCLHFGAAKNEHATLTIYRCSLTCWHLQTPALAQIHHRTKNQGQIAVSISWTRQEPRGLVEALWFRIQWYLVQIPLWSTLYFCVTFFFSSEESEKFQSHSHVQRWSPHMRTSEVYKNLPAGY